MSALLRLQSLRGALYRPQVSSAACFVIRSRSGASMFAPRTTSVALFSSKTKHKYTPRADPNAAKLEELYKAKPKPQTAVTKPQVVVTPPSAAAPAAPTTQPTADATPAAQESTSAAEPTQPKPATFSSIYEEQTKVKVTPPPPPPEPTPEQAPVVPQPPKKSRSKSRGSGTGFQATGEFPTDPATEAKRNIRNALVLAVVSVFVGIFYKLVRNVAMTQDVDEDEEIPSESILQSVAPTDEARQTVRFARYHTVRIVVPKENKDVEPQLNVNNVAAHMFKELPSYHSKFTTFLGCDKSVATLPGFGEFPLGMTLGPLTITQRTPTAILFTRKDPTVGDISIVLDVKKALVTENSSIFLACLGTVIQNPQPLPSTILSGSARLDASLTRLYLKRATMTLRAELGILKDPFYKSPAATVSKVASTPPQPTAPLVHPITEAPGQAGITATK